MVDASAGWLHIAGQMTYQAVSASVFNVGSLLVSPPTSGYGIEHNPAEANALNPAAVPKFKQIRMTGATLAQPDTTGAAELPVQAVLLMAPGTAVKDYEVEAGNGTKTLKTIALECGTGNQVCFDLRGDEDTGPPIIDNVVREYRMPDLIVQDEANMIMINTASGVEIASTDHPKSKLSDADDLSFSYEAFDAGVRTFRGPCPLPRDPLNPDQGGGAGPETTIIQGTAGMSIPNAGSDGVSGGGPRISVTFILCETSLRELTFTFDTGDNTAIPLGNSSLFLNFFSGTVSIAPQQPGQDSYVTVVLEVRFRGMQPAKEGSTLFARGVVTIDSRGLFDVQINAGIQVFAGIGVGVDGHFWVAWSPLDIGFIVEACVPFDAGFDAENFPSTGLCEGNELLFGSFKAHMWQGQGWQNRYDWLPDDDAIHVTARFEARLQIPGGFILDWGLVKLPPDTITLAGLKLAFGEFCVNESCTVYEWGILGAFTLLGYDIGAYYGFDTGISFILGSADYVLIDEAGAVGTALASMPTRSGRPPIGIAQDEQVAITVEAGVPSAMFGLAWTGPAPTFAIQEPGPGGRTLTVASIFPDVTVGLSATVAGSTQAMITVADPKAGDWIVDITNVDQDTEYQFFYFANRPAPQVTFEKIEVEPLPDNTIVISWTSNVTLEAGIRMSLYYDKITSLLTTTQEIGGPIVEHLPLDSTGVYSWNLVGLVSGSYRVYARLENDIATIVNSTSTISQAYSADPLQQPVGSTMLDPRLTLLPGEEINVPGSFRYRDITPPAPPEGVAARPEGISSVAVRWLPNDERDLSGYIVTCVQGTLERQVRVTAIQPATSALSETARVNGLNAVPADCSVQAYDASLNLSTASLVATAVPSGTTPGCRLRSAIDPTGAATRFINDYRELGDCEKYCWILAVLCSYPESGRR
ncbi:MAG: hypothetical protein HC893_04320 [Chloroflexaceae bacterium]|nr:hypothetical protein [Chloroflexaceae bacterium]